MIHGPFAGFDPSAQTLDPGDHELAELFPPADEQSPVTAGRNPRRQSVESPGRVIEARLGGGIKPAQRGPELQSALQPLAEKSYPLRNSGQAR